VSPLNIRQGGQALLDIHGDGFAAEHRAAVVKVKADPAGIQVVRQRRVNSKLIQAMVQVGATVKTGTYGIAVFDSAGTPSNILNIQVVK
jgi:hypothetical protein